MNPMPAINIVMTPMNLFSGIKAGLRRLALIFLLVLPLAASAIEQRSFATPEAAAPVRLPDPVPRHYETIFSAEQLDAHTTPGRVCVAALMVAVVNARRAGLSLRTWNLLVNLMRSAK